MTVEGPDGEKLADRVLVDLSTELLPNNCPHLKQRLLDDGSGVELTVLWDATFSHVDEQGAKVFDMRPRDCPDDCDQCGRFSAREVQWVLEDPPPTLDQRAEQLFGTSDPERIREMSQPHCMLCGMPTCECPPCPYCDGSGEYVEEHEPWAAETLGCGFCEGTGKAR